MSYCIVHPGGMERPGASCCAVACCAAQSQAAAVTLSKLREVHRSFASTVLTGRL